MSEERPQQNTDDAEEAPAVSQEADAQDPDVLLDVSNLEVDRITLEVEDLRDRCSLESKARACDALRDVLGESLPRA